MAIITMTLAEAMAKPLTEEQIKMLENLKDREPEPDEDCPEVTEEAIARGDFRVIGRVSDLTTERIKELEAQGTKVPAFIVKQVAEREQRELEIDKQDYDAAMQRYKTNPVSYSLDVIEEELKKK